MARATPPMPGAFAKRASRPCRSAGAHACLHGAFAPLSAVQHCAVPRCTLLRCAAGAAVTAVEGQMERTLEILQQMRQDGALRESQMREQLEHGIAEVASFGQRELRRGHEATRDRPGSPQTAPDRPRPCESVALALAC